MIGTRLGPYEILAKVGEGGMGAVYRARDTKLDRDVAIKVLPEAFAHDAERVARFTREAKVLASLNHPHIAGIYGLETGPTLPGLPAPPAPASIAFANPKSRTFTMPSLRTLMFAGFRSR